MILKQIVKEHINFRKQIFKLAIMDIRRTYSGTALGWAWAILSPSITIFVYWFVFTIGLRARSGYEEFSWFLWFIPGIIAWFYMKDVILNGTKSLYKYGYLITKMKFPISVVPTFFSISKFIIFLAFTLIVIGIFWAFGHPPTIYLLQLPFYMFWMFTFFGVFTMFTSMCAALSKDFSTLIKSLMTAVFWLSGIIYDPNTITNPFFVLFLRLNPVTYIVNGFRNTYVYRIWFFEEMDRFGFFLITFMIFFILAMIVYKKTRKEIPDVL